MSELLHDGLRLSDHAARTYSFAEIAAVVGGTPDRLRAAFSSSGLVLMPPHDEVSPRGGRGQEIRLHWRTVTSLLLVLKLGEFGFSLRGGEAAALAGAAFKAGLALDHLCAVDGPLLAVWREPDNAHRVGLVRRDAPAEFVIGDPPAARAAPGAWELIGTVLLDPLAFGRIVWTCAMIQSVAEGDGEAAVVTEIVARMLSPLIRESLDRLFGGSLLTIGGGFATGGAFTGREHVVGTSGPGLVLPPSKAPPGEGV